ncbi:Cytochrome C oxidase subunit II-like-transmembrane domain [Striga hermonthica]|uniref:Cytochrome C oxidase subunit II-like-transmembrane domain n=1 Tax=Striga hermonthica TaxID=68872 RepID=A0A9N7NPK6_STRHE|nr:Cytochrome C oxidase subunit II-like-transmembrane domain [Striga hermonthica]
MVRSALSSSSSFLTTAHCSPGEDYTASASEGVTVLPQTRPLGGHSEAAETAFPGQNQVVVVENEAGPSHQKSSLVLNKSLEASMRNHIARLEQSKEYTRLLEFENRDLQIRELKQDCLSCFQQVLLRHPALADQAPYHPQEAFDDFLDQRREELDKKEAEIPLEIGASTTRACKSKYGTSLVYEAEHPHEACFWRSLTHYGRRAKWVDPREGLIGEVLPVVWFVGGILDWYLIELRPSTSKGAKSKVVIKRPIAASDVAAPVTHALTRKDHNESRFQISSGRAVHPRGRKTESESTIEKATKARRLSGRKIIMNIELQYMNHEFDVEWRTAPHLTNPLDDCLLSLSLLLGELSQANLQLLALRMIKKAESQRVTAEQQHCSSWHSRMISSQIVLSHPGL